MRQFNQDEFENVCARASLNVLLAYYTMDFAFRTHKPFGLRDLGGKLFPDGDYPIGYFLGAIVTSHSFDLCEIVMHRDMINIVSMQANGYPIIDAEIKKRVNALKNSKSDDNKDPIVNGEYITNKRAIIDEYFK